jgi:putative ABC transport system substrate-binding protein
LRFVKSVWHSRHASITVRNDRRIPLAHRAPLILVAPRNNVPAVYNVSAYVRDGGLLSYGADLVDNYRRAASYVDRILRGAKPAELPVQLPTKFEMVVNLRTAKALGLAVSHRFCSAPMR